jgi:hypothetical protein
LWPSIQPFSQPGFKGLVAVLEFRLGRIARQEHADSAGLLRPYREWPRQRD